VAAVIRHERRDDRVAAEVPVRINGKVVGTTRNLSMSGVYFVTQREIASGQKIRFLLDLESPGGPLVLSCAGTVLRVETCEGIRGVAVSLDSSRLQRKA
jgi:hypothetical protein